MHFHPGQLDAPFRSGIFHFRLDGIVDLTARFEQLVQLHLAHHRTQRGLGQHLHRLTHIGDFVDGPARVDDLVVKRTVDFHRNVVGGDYRLAGKVHHGFATVNADFVSGDRVILIAHAHVADHADRAGFLDERNDDVDAALQHPVKRAQALDHHDFGLPDNDQPLGNNENANSDNDKADDQPRGNQCFHVYCSLLGCARCTMAVVPSKVSKITGVPSGSAGLQPSASFRR